jgi:endoglucanase
MKHLLFTSLALVSALTATTFAQTITPTRVGPVSQYGQLMTGKNSQGKGQIYGSCEGVKDGAEVQVRGMSLYWSLMPQAVEFWSEEGVSTMVRDMNIQIVRAAMATGNEDWSNGYKGYGSDPTTQMNLMKTVVEAAIKNDIYVIIDWHSHNANEQTNSAKDFFSKMAQEYGKYDNVIFELFNEPTDVSWNTIKTYADQVVSAIR